jgi:hypothetical protein
LTKEFYKMKNAINRYLAGSFALLAFSSLCTAMPAQASADLFRTGAGAGIESALPSFIRDDRTPDVPQDIDVPEGHKVHFHGFALGAQVYTWDGVKWGPAVPDATLFDQDGNVVATHFAGPTWRSNSGSEVVGELPPLAIIVDRDSIPWLRLTADKERTHGPGIFANTTFIHRINTIGGKAPEENGTFIGQVAAVPYSADYFFYRAANN